MYLSFIDSITTCIIFGLLLAGKRLEALSVLKIPTKLAYDVGRREDGLHIVHLYDMRLDSPWAMKSGHDL